MGLRHFGACFAVGCSSPLRGERPLRGRCRDVPPAGQSLSLLRQRKEPKKGDPAVAPYAALRAHTEAEASAAGKKELALLAFGQRSSDNFFSLSAAETPASARQTGARAHSSLRFAPRTPSPAVRERVGVRGIGREARAASDVFGPRLSRRAAQGWADKKDRLFEVAKRPSLRSFPPRPSSAEESALGRPAQWGRLFFGDFLLAKQKKVTAPPGAHPGTGRQAASPRRGETSTAPRNQQP
jgi:hypothetical protein